jgi:hypothetical protein
VLVDHRKDYNSPGPVRITGIDVDWGDGTPPQSYAGDPKPCRSIAPNRWPRGSDRHWKTIRPPSGDQSGI